MSNNYCFVGGNGCVPQEEYTKGARLMPTKEFIDGIYDLPVVACGSKQMEVAPVGKPITEHFMYNSIQKLTHDTPIEHFWNTKPLLEHGFFGLFGSENKEETNTTMNDTTKNLNEQTIKELTKVNKSQMIEAAKSMINEAVNDLKSENSAEMMAIFAASNVISISGAKAKSFTLSGVKQNAQAKVDATMKSAQSQVNTVKTKMTSKISDKISNSAKDYLEKVKGTDLGETAAKMGETVGSVANNLIGATGDVLKTGIGAVAGTIGNIADNIFGSSKSTTTNTNMNKLVENTFKLNKDTNTDIDESQKIFSKDQSSNKLSNALDMKNINKCATEASAKNGINLSDLDVEGEIKISDIEQSAMLDGALNCMFDQKVVNDIATEFVNDIEKTFDKLIDKADKDMKGDVAALGAILANSIVAAGDATSKTLDSGAKVVDSAGTAAAKVIDSGGEAGSKIVKETGEAGAKVASALSGPIMIGAIIGVIALVIYFMYFM